MTDYTKTTDFAAKDSLPSGDSGKIIKGTEFETEFDNIATAIATKSNTASPTFTGTTTIPTVDINGGAIDAVTLGTNSAVTEAQVDNININGNTISSSDTNGNVNISPNGTGTVVINTDLDVDNINVNGNAIISTNTNGNIDLTPNGTGEVNISKVDIDSGAIDGTVIGAASAAAITGTTITGTSFVTSGNMTFADNAKAIFGAGSDLQIYHDGTHSYVSDQGTGSLFLRSGSNIYIQNAGGTANYFKGTDGGASELFHNGSSKLATTSTGIDVTGQVKATSDFIAADSGGVARGYLFGTSGGLFARFNSGSTFQVQESGSTKLTVNSTGIDVTGTVTADGLIVDGATDQVSINGTSATGATSLSIKDSGTTSSAIVHYNSTHATNSDDLWIKNYTASGDIYIAPTNTKSALFSSNGDISFYEDTGTTAKLFWDASAESLGIGTTSPSEKLVIAGTGTGQEIKTIIDTQFDGDATTKHTKFFISSSNTADSIAALEFQARNASNVWRNASLALDDGSVTFLIPSASNTTPQTTDERMRLDSSGNVGIGTTSPVAPLTIGGTNQISFIDSAQGGINTNDAGGTASVTGYALRYRQNVGSGYHAWDISGSTTAGGALTYSERMRIDSSGNLLVGTTTASIAATNSTGAVIVANGASQFSRDGGHTLDINRGQDGEIVRFRSAGNAEGSISISGSTTSYNTSSDQRLKDNIVDAPSASDDIDAIQVRSFDWKADGSHQKYGMVAQELVIVAPNAVSQPEDPEEMMGVDYSKLVPMLIKEVQQLRARVAQLEGAN